MEEPTGTAASSGSAPAAQAGRPASEIFPDFMRMSAEAVDAAGSAGWEFEDGSAWDPGAADLAFNPVPCSKEADGSLKRELQLELKGPAAADPAGARDRMLAYAEQQGYDVARVLDPPADLTGKRTYIVTATRSDGALINYGANDAEQLLSFQSECSGHPSMEGEVSAGSS